MDNSKYIFQPRIRCVKPEFFKHEELYQAELDFNLPLRIAFVGLWCQSDRTGLFRWRPRQLKLDILPYDDVDFSHVLNALFTRGFIVRYRVEDEQYGCVLSFLDHQSPNGKETRSPIPDYDEKLILELSEEEINALTTRSSRVDHAKPETFTKRKEKKRKLEEKKSNVPPNDRNGLPLLQVNEKVFLTQKEIDKFITKFGEENYKWMIEKLNNHVKANRKGKPYDDDNAAIENWVIDALDKFLKEKKQNKNGSGKNNQNNKLTADDIQTAYNGVDDICGVL